MSVDHRPFGTLLVQHGPLILSVPDVPSTPAAQYVSFEHVDLLNLGSTPALLRRWGFASPSLGHVPSAAFLIPPPLIEVLQPGEWTRVSVGAWFGAWAAQVTPGGGHPDLVQRLWQDTAMLLLDVWTAAGPVELRVDVEVQVPEGALSERPETLRATFEHYFE
ncbi:hypothetical protein [Deinococcus maricopensis]|nr:hypothetical protein [Deinococcus maricopensis]